MKLYHHTQIGWIIIFAILIFLGLELAIFVAIPDARQVLPWVALLSIGVLALFSTLTVRVAEGWLHCQFGIGLIRRRIRLSDVQHAQAVRNRWWYGWGIRLTRHGWLWNVSGLDAVELTYISGKKFRVGTDESDRLLEAIQFGRMHGPDSAP